MKKIAFMIFILFIAMIYLLLDLKDNKKTTINPNSGNYDMVCSYKNSYEIEDETIDSITYAYITLDNSNVDTILMQTIVEKNNYSYDPKLADEYVDLFKNIEGIDYTTSEDDQYYIENIEYEFDKIDVDNVQSVLGDLLEADSFFTKENFSKKYSVIKEKFINEFECE